MLKFCVSIYVLAVFSTIGWGCSLAWWAKIFGDREDIADLFFSSDYVSLNGAEIPGLGLTMARYNLGACSWNKVNNLTMVESVNIIPERQIEGFWLDPTSSDPASDSWDWLVDHNQISMLMKAKDRGANVFELFSNSPMWWMLKNYNPSGSDTGTSDNLRPEEYDRFATYMVTVASEATSRWGITFDYIEMFNEPMSDWWTYDNNQEGCHFEVSTQNKMIKRLNKQLKSINPTKLTASDENSYTLAIDSWNSFSSATKDLISKVNVHGYEYEGGRRDTLYAETQGHTLWNSEYGEGDASGKSLISNLNLDFRWLHPTAWHYWQPLDSGGWGLIQSNLGDKWIGPVNTKYYALAHYSRHIRSGMTIIDGGDDSTISAYDNKTGKLVIVSSVMNQLQYPVNICYDLSGFASVPDFVDRWSTALYDDSTDLYRYYEHGL